ncbi:MAG: right-handed parallel beta-helix repeat-containing protein [Planctomycetes bacterium]|nr:right-handed parallel beta-helix repeat-containing protein [Planctomycetota bacterium]
MGHGPLLSGSAAGEGARADFYVATNGDDKGPGSLEAPFATLARARDAVAALRHQQGGALKRPVTVLIRGGTYWLAEPVEFAPRDSGSEACPVTYAAYPDEAPLLSGGVAITDWLNEERDVHIAALPGVKAGKWAVRQLFVRKFRHAHFKRRYRPCKGAFVIAGLTDAPPVKTKMRHREAQDEFRFAPGDIERWANLDDVEVVALHDWSASRLRIRELDMANHVVRFTGFPVYRIGHWFRGGRNPYYVENVKEAGLKPGEWYLDRPTGTLSYRPPPGERMEFLTIVVPRSEQLIRLVGRPEQAIPIDESDPRMIVKPPQYVEHVVFKGLTFAHTNWTLPAKGYSSGQGMIDLPAAIHAEFARRCRIERCTLAHLGGYAVRLGHGCRDNEAVGCRMLDLGGGGVLVGITNVNATEPFLPTGNSVSNCVISDGGLDHFSALGVWVGISAKTRVANCVVRRFPYTGISVGWSWNDKPTSFREATIEFNHIHDAMTLLADGGGIYTLGLQPGTVLRRNHIHSIRRSPFAGSAPNNGIFFDEGSKEFIVEGNVIHSTAQAPIRFNRSRQELHTFRDNAFGVAPDAPAFPGSAKAIVAEAGLEPAFRDVDLPAGVSPSPIHSMKLPPTPPPK